MLLIAHRGGTDGYPELTLDSVKNSLTLGADYVELDIRFTRDGVPVIAHDSDALRLFGVAANICDLTAEQFRSLRYTEDEHKRPHTLEDVLSQGASPILFHIKEGGEALVRILGYIRAYDYEDKVIIGVVNSADVSIVKEFHQEMKVLAFSPTKEQCREFIDAGADIIRLWEEWVDEPSVAGIHAAGKQVWVMAGISGRTTGYTSPDHIARWRSYGVDGVLLDKVHENLRYVK